MSYIPSQNVIDRINKYCENKPGLTLTIGVLEDGECSFLTYNGNGEFVGADTADKMYEIGSITKTFTACLYAKYVHEGRVDYHASIGPYINGYNDGRTYPTLDRLACHVSGLGRAPISTTKLLFKVISGKGRLCNIYSGFDGKKLEKHLKCVSLEPTDYPTQYTHYGFGALGYALGKIHGKGYRAAIEELVHDTFGLDNTTYGMPEGKCDGGYSEKKEKNPCWEWEDDNAMAGSDCLCSTARDLLKYADKCMSGELPWIESCLTPHSEYDDVDEFGYGFIIRSSNGLVWHNGSTGCFSSYLAFDREKKKAVVLLSDYEHVKGAYSVDKIGLEIISPKKQKESTEEDDYEPYTED